MSGAPPDLVGELLTQSLAAWRIAGRVERAGDGVIVRVGAKQVCITRMPEGSMFRWMVFADGRERRAISVVAALRQVREALDPDYAAMRVRVAVAPLVAS